MKKILLILLTIFIFVASVLLGVALEWGGTYLSNKATFINNKIDDATNYDTIKKVEDTCRSMIASYETDKTTYELYKDSDSNEKQSWSEQARMRANKTANTYNNYILKNSFVWSGNIPIDITEKLEVLK